MKISGRAVLILVGVVVAAIWFLMVLTGRHPELPSVPSPTVTQAEVILRPPAVAGGFYPADPAELRQTVETYLDEAAPPEPPLPGKLVALIAPHAGYVYSGGVAGYAYKCLEGRQYDTVVIIGPSHQVSCEGGAMSGADAWRTPLGDVPVDSELREQIARSSSVLRVNDEPHKVTNLGGGRYLGEHSVEVQLPFLQVTLDSFRVLPIIISDFSPENCERIGDDLAAVIGDSNVLLVASTDMSHYPAYEDAAACDKEMLEAICTLDTQVIYEKESELGSRGVANLSCSLCGLGPVVAVVQAAKALGADVARVLKYANSGDAEPAMRDRCVGYGAIALCDTDVPAAPTPTPTFPPTEELTQDQQAELLTVARKTLTEVLNGGEPSPLTSSDPALNRKRAVFVTLQKEGMLRGCIGDIEATLPLVQAVQRRAIDAALNDPRFPPVAAEELPAISIEISVLSPMQLCTDPTTIVPGKHGVMVVQGSRSGLYLPQVATEQGWDRETLLTDLCAHKAGLAPDAWKRGAKLYTFTAQVFGEHDQ